MKYLIKLSALIVISYFFVNNVEAQSQNFHQGDLAYLSNLAEAKEQAKATGKPLFIFLHRDRCGNCRGTWAGLKKDSQLQAKLSKEVIFVKVDCDGKEKNAAYWMVRQKGGSYSLPLMGIVDVNSGEVFAESTGYKSAKAVKAMLEKIPD